MDKIIRKSLCFLFLSISCLLHGQVRKEYIKDQVCALLPSIEGWCSQEKALAFFDLVFEVEPDVCVEIGVFGGKSVLPVASALKFLGKGVVVGIDPWDKAECIKYYDPIVDAVDFQWWSMLDINYIFDSYCSMLKRCGLSDFCITVRSTSARAASFFKSIDILHIDGSSDEEVCNTDALLYLPLVRQGGYIWINDAIWPKRQNAIDLLSESCDFVKSVDGGNCLLFKKR